MKKEVYICDRCGDPNWCTGWAEVNMTYPRNGRYLKRYDLCDTCAKRLREFIEPIPDKE